MTIIIPMAGLSSRFTKAGYILPKYMLYVVDRSLFNISVSSFKKYFKTCNFLFVARNMFETEFFINEECKLLGIINFKVVILNQPTSGQAETVFKGIVEGEISDDEDILIFNIDTIRTNYIFPQDINNWDGYLEVFKGNGANWSYAKTENNNSTKVIETAEKMEISDNCSTGLYYFKSVKLFLNTYNYEINDKNSMLNESYVAPLYNRLIMSNAEIHINIIDKSEVVFCGIPQEYINYSREMYLKNTIKLI